MPFAPDVHIDTALTNLSIAFTQEYLVGDKIFPPVPVDKRSDRYFVYGREYFKKRDDIRRPGGVAIEWDQTLSTDNYNADEHSQRRLVTDAERRLADSPLSPEVDATEFLTASVQNNREFRQLSVATDPTQVTQNVTLSGTSQWSDYTNSTPLVVIRTAKTTVRQGVFKEANMLTLAYEVALVLADHPSIKDLIKYTDPENIQSSGLPGMFRGLMVNVAGAMQDTANEGAAVNPVPAFGKNALVHYTTPSVGIKTITFGYTFEAPDDTTGTRGFAIRKYREEARKGDYVECAVTYDLKVVAPLGGYLVAAAIA